MGQIDFSSTDAPLRRIGGVVPEDLRRKLAEGELHAGSRVVRAGESMYVTGGTVYSFQAGPEGLRFFDFRPRMDVTFRTVAETRAEG